MPFVRAQPENIVGHIPNAVHDLRLLKMDSLLCIPILPLKKTLVKNLSARYDEDIAKKERIA